MKNFQPVLPLGGLAGWQYLNRTMDSQRTAFDQGALIERETAYFKEKIGTVTTAAQLVQDHTLMKVALGAYGLDDDIGNKFYIRKILEEGTLTNDALANKMADKRYRALSAAFGFGDFATPSTVLSDFGDKITALYKTRQFEKAIGEQSDTFRLGMVARREIPELAVGSSSDSAKWFTLMGKPPLRRVMETALGLPSSFGTLDIDKQLEIFREQAGRQLGFTEISDLSDPDSLDKLVERFLIRSDIATGSQASGPSSNALTLLQSAGGGATAQSILLARL